MTISELRSFIQEQALKLYAAYIAEQHFKKIESGKLEEDWFEGESLSSNTSCMDNPEVCMSKPEAIIDPRPEL